MTAKGHHTQQDSTRWVVRIRSGLLIAFAVIVMLVLGSVLAASLIGTARLARDVAGSLMSALGRDAEVRLHERFDPFRQKVLEDYAAIREGRFSQKDPETVRSLLMPGLFSLPQVDSMAFAEPSGRHFLVLSYSEAVRRSSVFAGVADRLPPPDPARLQFITRDFRPMEWGDTSHFVLWEDAGRQLVQEWDQPLAGFDTLQRPWYKAAMAVFRDQTLQEAQAAGSRLVGWTEVFTLFTTRTPGISAAVAARDPSGEILVISYNLPLDDIAKLTASAQPSPRGVMFVMTDDERLLGPPHVGASDEGHANRAPLQAIGSTGYPRLAEAVATWHADRGGRPDRFRVELDGETWWAGFTPFEISSARRLWIGMLLPESDLVPWARQFQWLIAGIGIVAFVGSVLLSMYLARWLSEPLGELAVQSRRIASLDLSDASPIRSHLAELNMLSSTLGRMRESLRRHISDLNDATDRQSTLEAQLREAQKLEAVGLLAGGIAHDFNNLLQVIGGNAALAADSDGKDREASLDAIVSAVGQASQLTRQLLAFGRRQALRREYVEVNGLVTNHMAMVRRLIPSNIHVDCRAASEPVVVLADKGQVEQVLLNLCLNARDAMPDGGELTVTIEAIDLDEATARRLCEKPAGPFARIAVTDSGHGMTADSLERIFEPFFTTKSRDKGSGLGLAVVYGIVRQHGGHIAARSAPGQGAEFVVLLPREVGALAGDRATSTALHSAEDKGPVAITILLAEDNTSVRGAAERVLHRLGARVVSTVDGQQAVDIFTAHSDEFDLLFLDIMMPGLSGFEVAARCRALRPDIPVLFASGYAAESVGGHSQVTSNDTVLPKPYDPEALRRAVRKLTARAKDHPMRVPH
jgi:signal transduction histidine kinase/CheY-like chemotaxis protein